MVSLKLNQSADNMVEKLDLVELNPIQAIEALLKNSDLFSRVGEEIG